MTVGEHYLDETEASAVINIPIPATNLAAYLEATLTMLDNRINILCNLSSNTKVNPQAGALSSVEMNAFLKVIKNTRITNEKVSIEKDYIDKFFSDEDLNIMKLIREAQDNDTIDLIDLYTPQNGNLRGW